VAVVDVSVDVSASVSLDVAEDGKSERDALAELEELGVDAPIIELSYIFH
jgi:hypothetical protein